MADKNERVKGVIEEWRDELKKMESINFFPYVVKDTKEVKNDVNKENRTNHNCCGKC